MEAAHHPKAPEGPKTPLVLLVGFLGAGKTTLLKRLIAEARAAWLTPHVILNDFANARVDAEGLRGELASVIPITGSCVCCSSQYELLAALGRHEHRSRDVMLIETNGTTDAAALLTMLAASVRLQGYTPPVQLSVIDAKRWGKRWHGNHLEAHQLRTASHLYLSRTDEVSGARAAAVRAAVAALNPQARSVDVAQFTAELAKLASGHTVNAPTLAPAVTEAAHHEHHYAALSLPIPGLVDRARFFDFLGALPRQVVRAKGVVAFLDAPDERRMFQRVEADTELSPYPLKKGDVAPVLVLVGPSLPEAQLQAGLARLVAGAA